LPFKKNDDFVSEKLGVDLAPLLVDVIGIPTNLEGKKRWVAAGIVEIESACPVAIELCLIDQDRIIDRSDQRATLIPELLNVSIELEDPGRLISPFSLCELLLTEFL